MTYGPRPPATTDQPRRAAPSSRPRGRGPRRRPRRSTARPSRRPPGPAASAPQPGHGQAPPPPPATGGYAPPPPPADAGYAQPPPPPAFGSRATARLRPTPAPTSRARRSAPSRCGRSARSAGSSTSSRWPSLATSSTGSARRRRRSRQHHRAEQPGLLTTWAGSTCRALDLQLLVPRRTTGYTIGRGVAGCSWSRSRPASRSAWAWRSSATSPTSSTASSATLDGCPAVGQQRQTIADKIISTVVLARPKAKSPATAPPARRSPRRTRFGGPGAACSVAGPVGKRVAAWVGGAVAVGAATAWLHHTGGYAVAPAGLLTCPLHATTGCGAPSAAASAASRRSATATSRRPRRSTWWSSSCSRSSRSGGRSARAPRGPADRTRGRGSATVGGSSSAWSCWSSPCGGTCRPYRLPGSSPPEHPDAVRRTSARHVALGRARRDPQRARRHRRRRPRGPRARRRPSRTPSWNAGPQRRRPRSTPRPPPVAARRRGDRRGQALQPEQGRARRHRRPGRAGRGLRAGRRHAISVLTEQRRFGGSLDDLAAVRAPGRRPGAAQGLHRHPLPGLGGPGPRRRPRPAHRRGARADAPRRARRARPVARHDRRSSRSTTRRRPAAPSTPAPRVIGVNARNLKTLEVDRAAFGRLPPPSRRRRPDRRVRRPRPARRPRPTPAPAPTPCSSARPWSPDGDPRAPSADLVGGRAVRAPSTSGPRSTEPACARDRPGRLRRLRRAVRPRGPDRRARRARPRSAARRWSTPRSSGSSSACTAPTPAGRASSPRCRGSPSTPAARGSSSSARTSTTPARTRSTTCSARPC